MWISSKNWNSFLSSFYKKVLQLALRKYQLSPFGKLAWKRHLKWKWSKNWNNRTLSNSSSVWTKKEELKYTQTFQCYCQCTSTCQLMCPSTQVQLKSYVVLFWIKVIAACICLYICTLMSAYYLFLSWQMDVVFILISC